MFVAQAKAKYSTWPNPGASAWVAKKYQQAGGQYVETTEADRRRKMAQKKQQKDLEKIQNWLQKQNCFSVSWLHMFLVLCFQVLRIIF